MKKTLEPVPGLRPPADWEHKLVDSVLIDRYRKEANHKTRWPLVLTAFAALFGVAVVFGLEHITPVIIFWTGLIAVALYAVYSMTSIRKARTLAPVVQAMEQREYRLTQVWAINIRCVMGEGAAETYGLAHVRLDNGQMLKEEYVLPHKFAAECVNLGISMEQRVLLVHVPLLETYRLVPFRQQW